MEVEAAKVAYDAACRAFDEAVERSMEVCTRQAAIELGLRKGGLQPHDAIVAETDKALAAASMALWQAREALDAAKAALLAAEHRAAAGPDRFTVQLARVQRHQYPLYQRYQRERQAVEQVSDEEKRLRARHIMGNTRQEILRYEGQGVAS